MKIAIVANTSWYVYNFRKELISALLKNGHELITIAPVYMDEYSQKLIDMGCTHFNVNMDNKGTNPVKDIATFFNFISIYKKAKPDMIFHFTIKPNIYGTLAAKFLNIPCINNISGLGTLFIKEGFATLVAKLLYKISQNHPKHIFFQNNEDHEHFLKLGLVKKEKSSVLPGSGVDTVRFSPREKEQNDGKFVFLLIARMLKDKGIVEFVKAAEIVKSTCNHCEFQLLGFMDDKNRSAVTHKEMSEWIEQGNVKYLGPTDKVEDFIACADCVVLPSYREGTPRSLLEAASMGKPLITTDTPGCRNVLIDNENGYFCKVKDPNDLAQKMKKMVELPHDQIKKMGERSRRLIIEKYDVKLVIWEYLKRV